MKTFLLIITLSVFILIFLIILFSWWEYDWNLYKSFDRFRWSILVIISIILGIFIILKIEDTL